MRWAKVLGKGCLVAGVLVYMGGAPQSRTELGDQAASWYYPGARELGAGELVGKLRQAVLTTPDSLEKVLGFYEKKCADSPFVKLTKGPDSTGILLTVSEPDRGETIVADDSHQPDVKGGKHPPRPVVMRMLTRNTADHFVTIAVSRGEGEAFTHMVVTFLKR